MHCYRMLKEILTVRREGTVRFPVVLGPSVLPCYSAMWPRRHGIRRKKMALPLLRGNRSRQHLGKLRIFRPHYVHAGSWACMW